jgi:hypothetical protein
MKGFFFFFFLFAAVIADAQRLIPYRGKNGWGYADTTGKVVIEPNASIKPQVGMVLRNGNAVHLDLNGKQIDPDKYYPDFKTVTDKATGKKKYAFCGRWNKSSENTYDNVIELDYHQSWYFGRGYFIVGKNDQQGNMRQGVIDSTGQVIIPLYYNKIYTPWDGFLAADSSGSCAIYTYGGREVLSARYRTIYFNHDRFVCSHDDHRSMRSYDGPTYFFNSSGKFLFTIKENVLHHYFNLIVTQSDSIRFYNPEGKWIFSVDTAKKALAACANNYIQFINYKTSGKYWIDGVAIAFELYTSAGKFLRRDSTDHQVVLKNGSVLIRRPHQHMISSGHFHYLLIDKNGNTINDIEADTILNVWQREDGRFLELRVDDKLGWISGYDGRVVVPGIYREHIWTYIPKTDDYTMGHSGQLGNHNFVGGEFSGAFLLDTNGLILAGPYFSFGYLDGFIYAVKSDSILFLDTQGKILKRLKGGFAAEKNSGRLFNNDFMIIDNYNGSGILRMADMKLIFPCIATSIGTVSDLFYIEISRQLTMDTYFELQWYVDKDGHSYIDPGLLKTIPE